MRLTEICDLPHTPSFVRDAITDLLGFYHQSFCVYRDANAIIEEILQNTGSRRVVDLCSGNGSHLNGLRKSNVEVIASDLRPNVTAAERLRMSGMQYIDYPVNATKPLNMDGVRTIFSALHHFDTAEIEAILRNAQQDRAPFAFFEFTEASFKGILGIFLGQIFALVATPFIRPFSYKRIIFTYLIPVIPLVLLWDGMVSCMRTYHPSEIEDLAQRVTQFKCRSGVLRYRNPFRPNISFVYGAPK